MHLKLILYATIVLTFSGIAWCDKEPLECEVSNCQNGATCKPLTDGDICLCPGSYWGRYCEKGKDNRRDMTFLIGHSTYSNETEWQMILDFMNYIVTHIPIGENASEIAIVTYSGQSRVIRKLNDPNDLASIKKDIIQLEDVPAPLDLADALASLHNEVYTEANGDRTNARNEVAFLIDGVLGQGHQKIVEEAEACRLAGIEVYVTAIGNRANLHQLSAIAIDDRHLRKIDSYDNLRDFAVLLSYYLNRWIGT